MRFHQFRMRALAYSALLCILSVFNLYGCFTFESVWNSQVNDVTWLPEISSPGNDKLVIITVPNVIETFGCIYCYKNSPNATCSSRGLYVAVFNMNGTLWKFNIFETGEPSSKGVDQRFKDFLESIPSDMVLAIALQGDIGVGDWNLIYSAVESAGGLTSSLLRDVNQREAYAFVTMTGHSHLTRERHVRNPHKLAFVETGFMYVEAGSLQFRVKSKVHSSSSRRQGVDFVVLTKEVAHPILKLNANVSSLRPGDKVIIKSCDFDWTKAEEKLIAECPSCEINEIRLSEPLKSMRFGKEKFPYANVRENYFGFQTDNLYIKGMVMNRCSQNDPPIEGFSHTKRCPAELSERCQSPMTSARPYLNARDQIRMKVISPDFLFIGDCGIKGRGIFTKVNITKFSYVMYYHGRRLAEHPGPDEDHTYLFEVTTDNQTVWIDGIEEDGSYARLMNDNHRNPNLKTRAILVDGEPHVAFFSIRDITAGEELTYDYGGDPAGYLWRDPEDDKIPMTSAIPNLSAEDQIRKKVIAPDYLYIGHCGIKGRGIFTRLNITKFTYVVFYHGRRFSVEPDGDDTYLFEVTTDNLTMWIDAIEEDGSFGRLMNDNHKTPNIESEVINVDGEPHIAFYTSRDVMAGEELTYDYGGDPTGYFWRDPQESKFLMKSAIPNMNAEDQIRKKVVAPDYLYIGHCGFKGRGIFTNANITKYTYVLYYHGRRLDKHPDEDEDDTYLFEVTTNNQTVWIDAFKEDGSYGRLMNDNHTNPNLVSEVVTVDDELHVAFYAIRDIKAGEELTFDYGGDPTGYVWRNLQKKETPVRSTIPNLNAEDQISRKVIAPDYLYIGHSGIKGRGIFTKLDIPKNSYVLYYNGKRFAEDPGLEDITYQFKAHWGDHYVWIDATEEDGSFGRLLNDDHLVPNLISELVYVGDELHVAFYATRDIKAGEELTFDYNKEDPVGFFWRERADNLQTSMDLARAEDQIRKEVIAPDYLYIGEYGVKGRGIITKVNLDKDSYVLYYHGKRLAKQPDEDQDATYLFEVTTDTQTVWIDAADEDGSFGRLMNDNHINPNIESDVIHVDGEPHIAFFAVRDIMAGEELTYDYGGDPAGYFWRNPGLSRVPMKSAIPNLSAEDQIRKKVIAPDYLYIEYSGIKGRGIFTKWDIMKNSYVLYYNGKRFAKKPTGEDETYFFSATWGTDTVCFYGAVTAPSKKDTYYLLPRLRNQGIDATEEDGSFGRLLNDNHILPNIISELVYVGNELHVAFYAIRDIKAGEELTFNYGGDPSGYVWRDQEEIGTFPITSAIPNLSAIDQINKRVISPDYLIAGDCGSKGRGLFTKENILKHSYVIYYDGKRFTELPDIEDDTYLFAATMDTRTVWIDSAEDDGSYARLLNDDHIHPNLESDIVENDGELYIVFYALRNIKAGEELTFDYGGDPTGYSWRNTEESSLISPLPKMSARDQINKKVIAPDYLYIGDCGIKGRGIFTKVNLLKGSYVIYYHGKRFAEKPDIEDKSYLFRVTWDADTVIWIDGFEEDGSYARLMNDNHRNPNLLSEAEYIGDELHVTFYAVRDVKAGEELTFDYGGDPDTYVWRNQQTEEGR